MTTNPWHRRTVEQVLQQLDSSPAGLSEDDARKRLAANGPNELRDGKGIDILQILTAQFKSLIVWVLIGAGALSFALGEHMDALAILAIVVLNAAIGFYQEFNAERSIAALRKMTAPLAKVVRGNEIMSVPAADIVTGDILALEAGDIVAADTRLMSAASLQCIEAALTGESETVNKHPDVLDKPDLPLGDRKNMAFMGTSVAAGAARGVVVATGMDTELGHIAGLLETADPSGGATPLQRRLDSFGRILVWASLGIVAMLFALGLARGVDPMELFMTSVSLAVAAVPEGLPAIVTVALSLGALRMARRGALIRKLAAVETLGSTSVICTDKTGTLTFGEMAVRVLYVAGQSYEVTGEGYGPEGEVLIEGRKPDGPQTDPLRELATVLIACNFSHLVEKDGVWTTIGDPTEGALLAAGLKAGGDRERIENDLPKQHEFPFDSDRKRSTMIRRMPNGGSRAFVNGAPGPLLKLCSSIDSIDGVRPLTPQDRQHILAQTSAMAKKSLRVLASARRDLESAGGASAESVERDLVFIGLAGMYDPPRPEAKTALAHCRAAGIRVVMITGDHPETAKAIASEIGITTGDATVIDGVELDTMSDEDLAARASTNAVYARVTAAHKLRIVRALKSGGSIVAMTGDGVNDAPAIKGADIGIAMGRTGAEVTRQAADMILTGDNFATIVDAVEEGRGIYGNIRKTLQYLLAGNTGELLLMTVCSIAGLPSPLLPIHLLWINLVTDGVPALCLATDAIDEDVMNRPPRPLTERIMDSAFLRPMLLTGCLTAGVALAVYLYILRAENAETARTYAFAALVFAELLRAFGARSETKPVWRIPLFTNVNLAAVVAVSIGLQVWSQHNAALGRILKTSYMPFADCAVLLALSAIPLLVLESIKIVRPLRNR